MKLPRRHPCEVTSDRLADHMQQFAGLLDGADLDEFSHVRHLLESIADGSLLDERNAAHLDDLKRKVAR